MRIKTIVKLMFFSIGVVSTLLAIWSIWIKIKPNEKAKQHKIGANWMEFQQSMSYNLLLHKTCMSKNLGQQGICSRS
jgi:hypothetical protein